MSESELRRVTNEADWEAYHRIRESVLWTARGRLGVYDRSHPDEHADGNNPFLFVVDDEPIGVLRVDLEPPTAWFRRVAIREDHQRRGHGRRMLELAMDFARLNGCIEARSNVDPVAVSFYRRLAFEVIEGVDAGGSIPMRRKI